MLGHPATRCFVIASCGVAFRRTRSAVALGWLSVLAGAPAVGDAIGFKSADDIMRELMGGRAEETRPSPVASPALASLFVRFALGSSELTAEGMRQLDQLAYAIRNAPEHARFEVAGHTDARGNADMNLWLSTDRAEAAIAYLVVRHELSRARFSARGCGETRLRNARDPYAADNRRVEVRLLP